MAQKVTLAAHANKWIVEPAARAYTRLEEQWNVLGRSFSIWSDSNIPTPFNNVAKKIFYSLPIAAAICVAPFWLSVVAGVGCYVGNLAYGPFEDETYDTIFAGAFVGTTAVTLYNAIGLVTSLSPGFAIGTAIYGIASALLFPHSKMMEE